MNKSNVVAITPKELSPAQSVAKFKETGYSEEEHRARVRNTYNQMLKLGMRPVLLHPGLKKPVVDGWQKSDNVPEISQFSNYCNIGVALGDTGNHVIDLDIDDPNLIDVIEYFLPPTQFKFGRYYGKDKLSISHYLYKVQDCNKIEKVTRPYRKGAKSEAIEIRNSGCQTMMPTSAIFDKELGYSLDCVRWFGNKTDLPDGPIPETTREHVIMCARVCIVTHYSIECFNEGQFHHEMLWWCGFLMACGVTDELMEKSIRYLVEKTGQTGLDDRLNAIKTTRKVLDAGDIPAGIGYLSDEERWPREFRTWLKKTMNYKQKDDDDDTRPSVRIVTSKEPEWLELTLKAMMDTNKFYQMSGQSCVVTRTDDKAHVVMLDKSVNTSSWLTREIKFIQGSMNKATGEITDQSIKCPTSLAQEIADASTFKGGLPHINGVCDTPLITKSGRIIEDYWAYDTELRLFFAVSFPYQPMYMDTALPELMDVLCDFPFLSERYRAAALGAILTAVVRPALDICPIFVITSSQYSDGKSVLSGVIAASVGVEASLGQLTRGGSDEEQEKQLSAILSRGRRIVTLDNHDGEFRSAALTEALTSTNPEFRILGKNETRSVPNKTMFLLNGVNTAPSLDLQTRSVFIKLARTDTGSDRKFKYTDVVGYALNNRVKLVGAAISVIKHAMSLPDGEWKANHRFKTWDYMVRRTVFVLTGIDIAPPSNEDCDRPLDPMEEAKHSFLDFALKEWLGGMRSEHSKTGKYFRATDIMYRISPESEQETWVNTLSKRPRHDLSVRVGVSLSNVKEYPFVGPDGKTWRLESFISDKRAAYQFTCVSV